MAQGEIIRLLSKNKLPLRSKRISEMLGVNHQNICHNLKKLKSQKIILSRVIKVKGIRKPIKVYWLNINYL